MSREEALEKAELFESGVKEDKSGNLHRVMQMLDLSEDDVSGAILKKAGSVHSQNREDAGWSNKQ